MKLKPKQDLSLDEMKKILLYLLEKTNLRVPDNEVPVELRKHFEKDIP